MTSMKPLLFSLLLISTISYGQVAYQSGKPLKDYPLLTYNVPDSLSPSGTAQHKYFLTINNYDISGTSFTYGKYLEEADPDNYVTRSFVSWPESQPSKYFFTCGRVMNSMLFAAGLSHQTALPIRPIVTCSQFSYPVIGQDTNYDSTIFTNWEYEVPGIEYYEFNPKLIGFSIEDQDELNQMPYPFGFMLPLNFIAALNASSGMEKSLQIRRIGAESGGVDEMLVEIPLQDRFYINGIEQSNGQLIVYGFELNQNTGYRKKASVCLVELESGNWQIEEVGEGEDHFEVVSAIQNNQGQCVTLVKRTNVLGEWIETSLKNDEEILTVFKSDFRPAEIVNDNLSKIRLGGDYDHHGSTRAVIMDYSKDLGSVAMLGYCNQPGKSYFHQFLNSNNDLYLVGLIDGDEHTGAFFSKLHSGSLLSLSDDESSSHVFHVANGRLTINQNGRYTYWVTDLTGRIIRSGNSVEKENDLDLGSGVYVFSVAGEDGKLQSIKGVVFR